ncbi:putative Ring finger protein 19 (Dorfin) (Double ring-finger protein) [Fasciolopsis buskii]|uniref:Putative Ring finger protein 19 (Dorfin) (Double ring-finger protein) n=1 Tax=Fasciolopsis buskii TaxID=27845 RepID=A0A8E0VPS4_9TREM|nr:putative Ring finger protein 19 (Dorfin) (Double ring-finger protein) [Fasciolopsis buski]
MTVVCDGCNVIEKSPIVSSNFCSSATRTLGGDGTSPGTLSPCTNHDGECPVCFQPNPVLLQYSTCSHMACTLCWLTFLCTEIDSFAMSRLTCIGCKNPLSAATVIHMLTTAIQNPDLYGTVGNDSDPPFSYGHCVRMLSRYEEFLLRKALSREPDVRWCPSGCGYGLIAQGFKACPRLSCQRPECHGRAFCYNCQRPWNPSKNTTTPEFSCDPDDSTPHLCTSEAEERNDTVEGVMAFFGVRRLRRRTSTAISEPSPGHSSSSHRFSYPRMQSTGPCISEADGPSEPLEYTPFVSGESASPSDKTTPIVCPSSAVSVSDDVRHSNISLNSGDGGEIKACPRCKSMIQKLNDGSCNDMVCAICGFNFCWLCLRENTVGHYLSLSGCTVWGRQQWSTRRRIFTLLALLLGTPVLLPIIVAVGIPAISVAIIVGLTCWVNEMLRPHGKHKRRFAIFLTCLSSLLIAPVIASLIAAIVVPIVLGYVYLYLPICVTRSLCRGSPTAPRELISDPVESVPIPVVVSVDDENTF